MTRMTQEIPPRDILVARLRDDLLGPASEREELTERPTDRYLTGILFPSGAEVPGDEDEALGGGESDEADDAPAPMASATRPSTCGLSFALSTASAQGHPTIQVEVTCAEYEQVHVDPATAERTARPELARRANERWQRRPLVSALTIELAVDKPMQTFSLSGQGVAGEIKGAEIVVRAARANGLVVVTLVLVNRRSPGESRVETEASSLFQTCVRVSAVRPAALTARPSRISGNDRDSRVSSLIYRAVLEYAVGHTCSATWGPRDDAPEWVTTDWLPSVAVKRMKAEGDKAFSVVRQDPKLSPLTASWMARDATDAQLVAGLSTVVNAYSTFLEGQDARVSSLSKDLQLHARENLDDCRTAAKRMMASVDLIASDAQVRLAWRLAAGAMALQFSWTKERSLLWHPFQLGFQLLVLSSLVDRRSPERDIMDLLWFPTGGGKTEAYLALTAFLLFYRRIRDGVDAGAGTSVLMRYTLRLLTVQQFQRAAALTLACEAIRRGEEGVISTTVPALGVSPFSIGLWVGGDTTPNNYARAVDALRDGGKSSPRQLERCPRCRSRLIYEPIPKVKAVHVTCSAQECYFSSRDKPMPIWVVDTDVYRERPSLVIATLDKLAQIVRKEEPAALFGIHTTQNPPDLIIQDELHLISGPLGSLAGLFEVAVDRLSSQEVDGQLLRPKVIGSTATIRRAEDQVKQLFDRSAFQFPPPVIDATNSGFGIEDTSDPGRLYVGLTTAGRSAKFSLQATYASLLQSATDTKIARGIEPGTANHRDRYWTLTGYFNSLRELGGAVTLVMDDVLKAIRGYARRHNENPRNLAPPTELTSRVASSEIPATLTALEVQEETGSAIDVLLASNMISVGVDINRLGLMVVASQPKAVAEYIQATSRVGRQYPGLVVIVYNHPRVRDRSFFETFSTCHRCLYRAVEATSVTPFASRARDKALHAVVVALARHLVGGLGAAPILRPEMAQQISRVIELVARRAAAVDGDEAAGTLKGAETFVQDWQRLVVDGVTKYWDEGDHLHSLLIGAELSASLEESGEAQRAWPTPNSMREVEPSSLFRLWFAPSRPGHRRRRGASDADE